MYTIIYENRNKSDDLLPLLKNICTINIEVTGDSYICTKYQLKYCFPKKVKFEYSKEFTLEEVERLIYTDYIIPIIKRNGYEIYKAV